jgi:hypothetical protein
MTLAITRLLLLRGIVGTDTKTLHKITTANSVFMKLWQDGKRSAINRYFAFVVN